jgi:hypothetical protein
MPLSRWLPISGPVRVILLCGMAKAIVGHLTRGPQARFVILLAGVLCFTLSVLASSSPVPVSAARAKLARAISGADTAHLHLVHQHEEVLEEEGTATGALPGPMRAELDVQLPNLKGTCTIKTAGGTITGEGRATAKGSGRWQSFHGTLLITKGTGRFKDIHGRAGLYGTFDTRTYALVVQTTGTLSY